jgi:hypothetical protein
MWNVERDLAPELCERAGEQKRGRDPVDVVVALNEDRLAVAERALEAVERPSMSAAAADRGGPRARGAKKARAESDIGDAAIDERVPEQRRRIECARQAQRPPLVS